MINLITFKYLWDIIEGLWKEAYDANTEDEFEYIRESIEDFKRMIPAIEKSIFLSLCEDLDKIKDALDFKHLNNERNWENLELFKNDFGAYDDSHDIDLLPK